MVPSEVDLIIACSALILCAGSLDRVLANISSAFVNSFKVTFLLSKRADFLAKSDISDSAP